MSATKTDLTNSLLTIADELTPLYDAADGMRADLARRGWSPTAAEQCAASWLAAALAYVWQSVPKPNP